MTKAIRRSIGLVVLAVLLGLLAAACIGGGSSQPSPEGTPSEVTPSLEPAGSPATSTCAADSTDAFRDVQAGVDFAVYCPTFLPPGFARASVTLMPGHQNPPLPQPPFLQAEFTDAEGNQITILQGDFPVTFTDAILAPYQNVTTEPVSYGDYLAIFYAAPSPTSEVEISSMILGQAADGAHHFITGRELSVDLLKQVASGMAQLEQ